MNKYQTWKEFFNGNEFKEHVMDYLLNCGEDSDPFDYRQFKFSNKWYVYGDMLAVLDEFEELVIEPVTRNNCVDLCDAAWEKEIEIAKNFKTINSIYEIIKLNEIKRDFN